MYKNKDFYNPYQPSKIFFGFYYFDLSGFFFKNILY